MALTSTNLTALATGNGFTLWHYTTTDTIATVNTAGYFNAEVDRMNAGDLIIAWTSTGSTPVMTLTQVLSNDGTTVDVADGTTLAATDTD